MLAAASLRVGTGPFREGHPPLRDRLRCPDHDTTIDRSPEASADFCNGPVGIPNELHDYNCLEHSARRSSKQRLVSGPVREVAHFVGIPNWPD